MIAWNALFSNLHFENFVERGPVLFTVCNVVVERWCFHKRVSRILSTGTGCLLHCMLGYTPSPRQTPQADTPRQIMTIEGKGANSHGGGLICILYWIACQQGISPENVPASGSHSQPMNTFPFHRNHTSQSHGMAGSHKGSLVNSAVSGYSWLFCTEILGGGVA